ncbi:MAG: PAS domain S-box protein [Kouleothrix sp.]|nr:PAS domain S-box protein [Kouleothrix sp.]
MTTHDEANPQAQPLDELQSLRQRVRDLESAQLRLAFLTEAGAELVATLDYEARLQRVADLVVPQLADWCVVMLVAAEDTIESIAAAHADPAKTQLVLDLGRRHLRDRATAAGAGVLGDGRPALYAEVDAQRLATMARDAEQLRLLRAVGVTSAVVVPLAARGQTLGAIAFGSAESGRRYGPDDLALAEDYARQAALAIDNARLHRQMRQSRDQVAAILRGVSDGVTVQDSSGRLIYANDVAALACGYPSAAALLAAPPGQALARFTVMDKAGQPVSADQLPGRRALSGQPAPEMLLRFRPQATGEERWSLVRSTPVLDERGQVQLAVTTLRDITEIKQAERQVRDQREWLAVTLASIGDAVIATDAAGRVAFMNPVAEALTGWSQAQASGQDLAEVFRIVNEQTHELADSPAARVLREGAVVGLANHTVLIAKDGAARPIDDSGAPIKSAGGDIIGVVLVFRDMTERRQAEQALLESEARFRTMADHAPVLIWMAGPDGRCNYFNDGWLQFTGRSFEQELGDGWVAGIHPDDRQRCMAIYRSALGERRPFTMEYRLRRADGEYRWVLANGAPRWASDGSFVGYIGSCVEIDERIRIERRLSVQYAVARILAEAATLQEVMPALLQAVCEGLEWDWGALWVADRRANVLRCESSWQSPSLSETTFAERSRALSFAPGAGLPGRVWAAGEPTWLVDIVAELGHPRSAIAGQSGLHGMVAAPIRLGGAVLGVLELASRAPQPTDQAVLAMVSAIGSQIGQFIERAQAKQGLARYQLLSENARDIILFIGGDGQILEANDAAVKAYGYSHAELLDRRIYDLRAADTQRSVESQMVQADSGGVIFETVHRRKNGEDFPVEVSSRGAQVGADRMLLSIIRDISERKQAERRQHFLADASSVLAGSLDYEVTLQSITRLAVPAIADWCAVHMVESDGTIRRLAVAHVDPDKQALASGRPERYALEPGAQHIVPQVVRSGQPELYREVPDQLLVDSARDEEHLQLLRLLGFGSYMCVPMHHRGRVLGTITLVTARSGRRYGLEDLALAEELAHRAAIAIDNARLYREAQDAIRLRDQFLSIASHELKTPLTSLFGNAQMLQRRASREGDFDERHLRALNVIADQAGRLNKMIAALLDISRIQMGQLSIERAPVDLAALADRVVSEVQPLLEDHAIDCQAAAGLQIEGDELRLEQVLQNLIQNAIKYSPAGGTIRVRAERCGDQACLSVADQGIGIPADALPNLFQRFYRAANVDEQHISGMGVGLYVVREIVTLHGGQVAVASEEGQGSTFTIRLPLLRRRGRRR